ncbi:MAG: VWA domain-containing protein [Victivallaceae bacterium]
MNDIAFNEIIWSFPGQLTGLIITFAVGAAVIVFAYLRTIRPLAWYKKTLLIMLRIFLWAGVLIIAADPRITSQESIEIKSDPKITLLMDNSNSMHKQSTQKLTRFNDAMVALAALKQKNRDDLKYDVMAFDDTLHNLKSTEDLKKLAAPSPNSGTNLLQALEGALSHAEEQNSGALVIFSDGIDTESNSVEAIANLLSNSTKKIIFYPMDRQLPQREYTSIEKLEATSKLIRGTSVNSVYVVNCAGLSENDMTELVIYCNDKEIERFALKNNQKNQGFFKINGTTVGIMNFRAELLRNRKLISKIEWTSEVVEAKESCRILLYAGAFDWGIRHLRDVLENDEKNQLTIHYSPDQFPATSTMPRQNFPNAVALKKFDAVVLLNITQTQLTDQMQEDLTNFVNQGGGLLFLSGNPINVLGLADTKLEKMLPVYFSNELNTDSRADRQSERLLATMHNDGSPLEQSFISRKEQEIHVPQLNKIKITPVGAQSPIFKMKKDGRIQNIELKFQEIAFTKSAKPGANVLATWQDPKTSQEHIVLATQNFGSGRSVVMTVDPLWRWKLSLPSNSMEFQHFWRNLFQYTAGQSNGSMNRWDIPNQVIYANGNAIFRYCDLAGNSSDKNFRFLLNEVGSKSITLLSGEKNDGIITLQPSLLKEGKSYQLSAVNDKSVLDSIRFNTQQTETVNKEDQKINPDEAFFTRLSELPNVSLATANEPVDFTSYFNSGSVTLENEVATPIWYQWQILVILLALLLAEWIIRRYFKLV